MLRHAKNLATKNQSQPARSPFCIVWLNGAARLVNFTIQRVVCHHETSLKLKLELKKETSVSYVNSLLHHNFTQCVSQSYSKCSGPSYHLRSANVSLQVNRILLFDVLVPLV